MNLEFAEELLPVIQTISRHVSVPPKFSRDAINFPSIVILFSEHWHGQIYDLIFKHMTFSNESLATGERGWGLAAMRSFASEKSNNEKEIGELLFEFGLLSSINFNTLDCKQFNCFLGQLLPLVLKPET